MSNGKAAISSSARILSSQYNELKKRPVPGFEVSLVGDDLYNWEVDIIGAPGTLYEGGYFRSRLTFHKDHPFHPPEFRFLNSFFHPNVYTDGKLCISILHPPQPDEMSGERPEERWNPTQSVESILISVISLLNDPNCSSPANVDAGKMFREEPQKYKKLVLEQVEKSKKDIPQGYKMPTKQAEYVLKTQKAEEEDDGIFWDDTDDDFGNDDDDAEEPEEDPDE